MPEPQPFREANIIDETVERLFKESKTLGYNEKLWNEKWADWEKRRNKLMEEPEAEELTTAIRIIGGDLVRIRTSLKIQLGTYHKMLEVLLSHLNEDKHREAVKALRGLRLQDVIGG